MPENTTITHYEEKKDFNYRHSVAVRPRDYPIDIHDFFELYCFISGDMTFYIEGQAYPMKPGDILVINSDELHRAQAQSDAPYERVVIHFTRNYIAGYEKDDHRLVKFLTKRKLGHFNLIEASKIDTTPIFDHLKRIDEAIQEKSEYASMSIKAHFIQLLIEMNRIYSDQTESIITPKHYDERVSAILKFLNENIEKKITLDELESRFFVNKYHLCHLFKKNTGFTVFEYISNKRIAKAKQLLIEGVPVIETCYTVGFNDYSNFYKVFKRVTGIPPKKFALQN